MPRKMTTAKFIERAKAEHVDKYDYSAMTYVDSKTKVTIICPEHGEFNQAPAKHLAGDGCPACSGHQQLSTKEFIEKARKLHGDKYDYSKVVYKNTKSKVKIICPAHGEFSQLAGGHLAGKGCISCRNERLARKFADTKRTFIEKSKNVHGDRYDYSSVQYRNNRTQVIIQCKEHGEFTQTPYSHLAGNGCPSCAGVKPLTTETFKIKSRKVHGNKYDYSKVSYINNREKVVIICPTHDEFSQFPNNHLRGRGCRKCRDEYQGLIKRKRSADSFISRAIDIHGNRYNYNLVRYVKSNQKVIVGCSKHGTFGITPDHHLQGGGCPACGIERRAAARTRSARYIFETDARIVHGDNYNYSKVNYVNAKTPVTIICPKHGEFQQTPTKHKAGQGCIKCAGLERITQAQFIALANDVHSNKYDYSLVEYINKHTPVKIVCREHGVFEQAPIQHLNGTGCMRCGHERTGRVKMEAASNRFVERAFKVQKGKYDYSLVDYRGASTNVTIICPEHGILLLISRSVIANQSADGLGGSLRKAAGVGTRPTVKWTPGQRRETTGG